MKKKVKLEKGLLDKFLSEQGLKRTDLYNTNTPKGVKGIDRKTVDIIANGEEVKLETLRKVNIILDNSLDNLFPELRDFETSKTFNYCEDETSPQVMLNMDEVEPNRLPILIKRSSRIRYKLEIEILTREQEFLLEKLENWIDKLHSHSNATEAKDTTDDNLAQQVARKRLNHGFFEIQEELTQSGVTVFAECFDFWERSDEFYNWFDIHFNSTIHLMIIIVPSSVISARIFVNSGTPPPTLKYEWEKLILNDRTKFFKNGKLVDPSDYPKVRRL